MQWLPQLTLAQYIHLSKDGWELYAPTAFCLNVGGIGGLGTHFRRCDASGSTETHWTGDKRGVAVHFQMRKGEQTPFIWVCPFPAISNSLPYLAVFLLHL